MGSEWPTVRLGDVVELKRGYDLPSSRRREGNVPVVSSCGPTGHHAEAMVDPPGVVTGRYGTIGKVFYVEEPFWPLNTTLYVRDFKRNDPRFISYLLRAVDYASCSDKAAVPGVNRNHLHELRVLLPPLDEQCRIASVLGALDDKIELNRRMSQTIDEMAQVLFKSWFVDGASDAESDASESWTPGHLTDIVENVRSAVDPVCCARDTPYVALDDMDEGRTSLVRWGVADQATSGKSAFRVGDVLFGKLRPYFHKVAPAPFDGICSTDIMVLRPKSASLLGFALGHVNSDVFIDYATARSEGTRMPRARWTDVAAYEVAIPPPALIETRERLSSPMIRRQRTLATQARQLAELRDALLPQLMSGRVCVAATTDV